MTALYEVAATGRKVRPYLLADLHILTHIARGFPQRVTGTCKISSAVLKGVKASTLTSWPPPAVQNQAPSASSTDRNGYRRPHARWYGHFIH
jgi:hypothetical protein